MTSLQSSIPVPSAGPLASALATARYVRLAGAVMRSHVGSTGPLGDWDTFAASWGRLEPDTYMADGGRYRRRRHAVFDVGGDGRIERAPHQPHFQSRDYNSLNGGIERWFAPVEDAVAGGETCRALLAFCAGVFSAADPAPRSWRVEMHQFRIEARTGEAGKPTPEGMHRDGVDYVLVMMVRRENIQSGETMMSAADGTPIGRFTLTDPFDAVLLDDRHVYHGVTPVEPVDPGRPAWRDVLVLTFKRA